MIPDQHNTISMIGVFLPCARKQTPPAPPHLTLHDVEDILLGSYPYPPTPHRMHMLLYMMQRLRIRYATIRPHILWGP